MERTKVLELIQLYVTGCMSKEELQLMNLLMEDEENFPWIELAEYQNLIVLIPSVLPLKVPTPRVKQRMVDNVYSLIYGKSNSTKKEVKVQEEIREDQNTKGKIDWASFSVVNSKASHLQNTPKTEHKISNNNFEEGLELSRSKDELVDEPIVFDDPPSEDPVTPKFKTTSRSWKYFAIPIIVVIAAIVFAVYKFSQEIETVPITSDVIKTTVVEEIFDSSSVDNDSVVGLVLVDSVRKMDTLQIADNKETEKKILPTAPPKLPEPIDAPLVVEAINPEDEVVVTQMDIKEEKEANQPLREEIIEAEEEPSYFVAVEEMPEPLGGLKTIQNKIVYPEIAKRVGVEGKVYVRAFVDEIGNVTKAELVKGIGAGCDEVAVDAVLNTQFKPGKQRGKPIKVQVTVPIVFKLR